MDGKEKALDRNQWKNFIEEFKACTGLHYHRRSFMSRLLLFLILVHVLSLVPC
jgi:hypothetical protein